ncbi:MAG: aminoacyl-tRNA hydrolase [Gammaproteobacteria bacterium]|nr:aminoacyl-tRNA hydrolase [Gammaproteobacteria bacterium]
MIKVGAHTIPERELHFSATHSQGPGGQNVNKVATAVELRFDIRASSLPQRERERLLMMEDQRLNRDGVIVIKAQESRSQLQNRKLAIARLRQLLEATLRIAKRRIGTRPSRSYQKKRVDTKVRHGRQKRLRAKWNEE